MLLIFPLNCLSQLQTRTPIYEKYVLPKSFNGTWLGTPSFNVIGPYAYPSYVFSISASPSGDYLLEVNIRYDSIEEVNGYQRFYLRGSGAQAGKLWYCGSLSNFADGLELTQHQYEALSFPDKDDNAVTFCLDKHGNDNDSLNFPFYPNCKGCECSNWTLTYDDSSSTLSSSLVMSGSNHLLVERMQRLGDPPAVDDSEMPSHDEDFKCEFEQGGRDSEAIERSIDNLQQRAIVNGCPHMRALKKRDFRHESKAGDLHETNHINEKKKPKQLEMYIRPSDRTYSYCYILNTYTDYRIAWSIDEEKEEISLQVSAPLVHKDDTWVAVGFRPMSRSIEPKMAAFETGRHYNFGMKGADIVVGSINKGVRTMYASDYVGEPVTDPSLTLINSTVDIVDNRVIVSFTRSYYGGHLAENFGINVSIVTSLNDILWAVGSDGDSGNGSGCEYHGNMRGMRPLNWTHPEVAMMDNWKC